MSLQLSASFMLLTWAILISDTTFQQDGNESSYSAEFLILKPKDISDGRSIRSENGIVFRED